MKTSNYKEVRPILYVLGAIILLAVIYFTTCEDDKTRNDPIKAPAAFAFIDANVVSNTYVPNVTVTLIDPDSLVRTSSGTSFTELILKNGVMNLGLHYQASVNEKEPYRYRIKAEAPGYVTTMETVLLTDEEPGYYPVFMTKLKTPPPGVGTENTALPVNSNGYVTSNTTFITKVDTLAKSRFSISIPAGTQLLSNCKGVSVPSGEAAKIQLASFDPTAPDIGRMFPNGFLVTDATNENGEVIARPSDPFLFASAGWISANIQVGDQEVDSFSKPVEGKMTIDSELINPETNVRFQAGDTVPIWSLDEDTGNWRLEEKSIVQKEDNGDLVAKFAMNHLSTWNLDYKGDTCPNVDLEIENPYPDDNFYVRIVTAQTGAPFTITGSGAYKKITNGINTIRNVPVNIPIAMIIYDENPPIDPLVKSQVIENCNEPTIERILIPESSPNMCVNLEVTIDGVEVSNNAIWYRACPDTLTDSECITWMGSGSNPWRYGGALIDGKLTTFDIDPEEERYIFQIWYDGDDFIKFLLNQSPFSLDQTCSISFDSSNPDTTIFDKLEPQDVVVIMRKTCSRTGSSSVGPGCPDPPLCSNCSDSDEVTVIIQITTPSV